MARYIVGYDLHYDRNYQPIWDLLKGWGGTRLVEALWVVTSNLSAQQISQALYDATGRHDSVAVVELQPGSNWATVGIPAQGNEWLRKNVAA
jgi:hypothetical protein